MEVTASKIPDVLILEPKLHGDSRVTVETVRAALFQERGIKLKFVQDNQSRSTKGTLQASLSVCVPARKTGTRAGRRGVRCCGRSKRELADIWAMGGRIPVCRKSLGSSSGFAHGFYVVSESADLSYKCTEYYHPEDDFSLRWDDPGLAIKWPLLTPKPLLSAKDLAQNPSKGYLCFHEQAFSSCWLFGQPGHAIQQHWYGQVAASYGVAGGY